MIENQAEACVLDLPDLYRLSNIPGYKGKYQKVGNICIFAGIGNR